MNLDWRCMHTFGLPNGCRPVQSHQKVPTPYLKYSVYAQPAEDGARSERLPPTGARPPSPRISRTKPVRSCAQATLAAIDATQRRERQPF